MSLAKLLGHLHSGDAIIVRAGEDGASRMRPQFFPPGAEDGTEPTSHKLLRSLIAARRRGGKN